MKPNILLVILDSVRARNTSLHGYKYDTTPFLNEFASQATKYEFAMAPAGSSQQSHTSIFTGLKSEEHGCFDRTDMIKPGYSIWESLRDDHGYATGVFSANTYFSDLKVGLNHGFDTVINTNEIFPERYPFSNALIPEQVDESGIIAFFQELMSSNQKLRGFSNGLVKFALSPNRSKINPDNWFVPSSITLQSQADAVVDLFLKWVEEESQPWAACINLIETHSPWYPGKEHDKFRETSHNLYNIQRGIGSPHNCSIEDWVLLEQLYNGAIHKGDEQVRRLVSSIEDQIDNTLVIITSDHGEAFGEKDKLRNRRMVAHGSKLHSVITHVPLLVKFPGQTNQVTIESVSTLRRFPSAVKAVLQSNDREDRGVFVPDSSVVATAATDNSGFERSVWVDESDAIRQIRGWISTDTGEILESITEKIVTPQKTKVISHDGRGLVETKFKDVSEMDIKTSNVEIVSDKTKRRMRELGYL